MRRVTEFLLGLQLWPMLRKEFIQLRRDRLTLAIVLVLPMIQLMLFGYAIHTEVRHLPTVVLDESRTEESRALVTVLEQTQNFDVTGYMRSRRELKYAIDGGAASAGVVIPPDYGRDVKRGRPAAAQVIVDAADPLSSSAAISGASLAAYVRSAELVGSRGRVSRLDVRVRPWYNPGLRSAVYIVPGLVGVILSLTLIVVTSVSVTRERERGTFEQLIVTPIDKVSMMLGKLLPFVIVGYVQMTTVLFAGRLIFRVPLRGSLVLLYVVTLGFIVASLALGLLVSTIVRTQVQAFQLSTMLLLPNILLCGFMFPRAAMPRPAQWLGSALPLTHYLIILRGILLRGVGIEQLWSETLVLFGFAVVLVGLSVLRFSKTLD